MSVTRGPAPQICVRALPVDVFPWGILGGDYVLRCSLNEPDEMRFWAGSFENPFVRETFVDQSLCLGESVRLIAEDQQVGDNGMRINLIRVVVTSRVVFSRVFGAEVFNKLADKGI